MFNDIFKRKIAASALISVILLTSCSNKTQQASNDQTTAQSQQTAAGTTVEPTTARPLNPDEDLSMYDLNDDDDLETVVSKMEQKYGIDIVYGNDIRTEFKDENETLIAKPNTNYKEVEAALRAINEGLNALPKGFIKQLEYGSRGILKIYLTGQITVEGVPGSSIPAFTSDSDPELYLTIEVLEQGVINVPTILHELTHIIDFKLKHDGVINEDEWSKFNPAGFAYDNSYTDTLAGKKDPKFCYTTEHYVPRNTDISDDDVWFYYSYSKVNAYEDRATMLENLVIYKMWNYEVAPGLYKCPHMKAKVEYYLKLIEKSFAMSQADKDAWTNAYRAIS